MPLDRTELLRIAREALELDDALHDPKLVRAERVVAEEAFIRDAIANYSKLARILLEMLKEDNE